MLDNGEGRRRGRKGRWRMREGGGGVGEMVEEGREEGGEEGEEGSGEAGKWRRGGRKVERRRGVEEEEGREEGGEGCNGWRGSHAHTISTHVCMYILYAHTHISTHTNTYTQTII